MVNPEIDSFILRYLLRGGPPSLKEALDELLLPMGYEHHDPGVGLDSANYWRHRQDGRIDLLLRKGVLGNPFENTDEKKKSLTYLCFNHQDDYDNFQGMRSHLLQLREREGITHRYAGNIDVNPEGYIYVHTASYGTLGAGIGFAGGILLTSYLQYLGVKVLSEPFAERAIGTAVLTVVAGVVGAFAGHYRVKKEVKTLQDQRSVLIQEYNLLHKEFKEQYGSRVSYDREALEKALHPL